MACSTPIWKDVFDAALSNDLDSVKYFIEEKGEPITTRNTDEKTLALIAAEYGHLSILKYVLEKNSTLLRFSDIFGRTVLQTAIEKAELEMVKYLVEECKVDIYEPNTRFSGNTAIHFAAQKGRLDMLKYFLEEKHVDVNIRNLNGEPLLFLAAEKPYMYNIKYMTEVHDADSTLMDSNNDNILFKSARRGDLTLPRYLLDVKKIDFDVNWVNDDGFTAVNLASKYNKVGFVNYLVGKKNASISIRDHMGRTPLHYAASQSSFHLCKYLVEHGADLFAKDKFGKTPMELAAKPQVNKYFFLETVKQKRNRRSVSQQSLISDSSTILGNSYWPTSLPSGGEGTIVENVSPGSLDSFLVIADTIMRYGRIVSEMDKHDALLSPQEAVRRRMNPLAIDAVNSLFEFQHT